MDNQLNKQLISNCFNNYEGIIKANLVLYKQINDIEIQIIKENTTPELFQNPDAEILQMDDLLGLQTASLKTIKLLKGYIVQSLSMYIYTLNVINEMSPLLNAILLMSTDKNNDSLIKVEELSESDDLSLQNGGAKSSVYSLLLNFMVLMLINSLYNKNVAANEIIPGINMGLQLIKINNNQPDIQTPAAAALDELDPTNMEQMKEFLQMFTTSTLQDYSNKPPYKSKNITSSFGETWTQDNPPQKPSPSLIDGLWNALTSQDSNSNMNMVNHDDFFKHVDEGVSKLNKLNKDLYNSLQEMCEGTMEVRTDSLPIELYRVLKQKMKEKGEFIEKEQHLARYENKEKALELATEISSEDKPEEPTIYEKYVDNSWLKTFSLSKSAESNTQLVEGKSKSKIATFYEYQDDIEKKTNELVPILNEASDHKIMQDAVISILNDVGTTFEDGNINNNRNIFFGSLCKIIDVPIYKFDKQSGILSMSNHAESLNYIKVLANNVNTWGKQAYDAEQNDDIKIKIQSLMEKSQYIVGNVLPSLNVGIIQAITKGTDLSQNVDEFFKQIIDAIAKSKFQIMNAISKNPITNKISNEKFIQDYENAQRQILESTREQALSMEEFKTSQNISNEKWDMTQEYLTGNIKGVGNIAGNATAATLEIVEGVSESIIDTTGNIGIKVVQKGAELISSGLMPFVTSLIWLALGSLAAFSIFVIIRTSMPIWRILGKRLARSMEVHDNAQNIDQNRDLSSEQTYVPPPRPPQTTIQGNNGKTQTILAPRYDLVALFGKPPLPPEPLPPTTRYTRWGPAIGQGGANSKKRSFRKGKGKKRTKGIRITFRKGKKGSKKKIDSMKRRTRKNKTNKDGNKNRKKTRKR